MIKSKTKYEIHPIRVASPNSVLTFDDDYDDDISIKEEMLGRAEDEQKLQIDDRIKCGEIMLICKSRQSIRFTCSVCGRELRRLDNFLRHTLQYHLLIPEGQLNLEDVLTAATSGETTDVMSNRETNIEHSSAISAVMKLEKDAEKVIETEDEVVTEMSYGEVEMLEESLEHSALEEQNIEIIASNLYETQQLKNIQNLGNFDDRKLRVKLNKLADKAYDELTKCFELDIEHNNADELSAIVATSDTEIDKEFVLLKSPTATKLEDDEVFEIEFLDDENMEDEASFKIPTSKKDIQKAQLPRHTNAKTAKSKKLYDCEYCDAIFTNSSNLKVHRYRHLGIKPHQCALCDKAFISTSELRLHMRSHTGERPYKCAECGQAFVCSAHLTAHRRRHTNERAYVCPTCGKGFYDRAQLREHARGHSDERPFVCEQCGMSFTRRKSLVEHEKLHADVKKYYCTICKMAFAQKSGLHAHMRKKHAVQR